MDKRLGKLSLEGLETDEVHSIKTDRRDAGYENKH
jgi:hypothetical protein